ncbi:MAG: CDP-diacylglycerol--glycerol-3-phosphate 3-phosphatidyltransferase [Bradymonadia bacterium]
MKSTLKAELLNLPNLLTLARVAAIPVVMALIWQGSPEDCVWAGYVYSAASITDFLDGWLARRQGLVTVMGKFLDPLADKLMVMAMLVMLVPLYRVPASLVVIILAREITITGLRAMAINEGLVIAAGQLGKYKTALQMMGIMCLVVHYPYELSFFGLYDATVDFHRVGIIVMWGSVFFSLTSAFGYFRGFFQALDAKRGEGDGPDAQVSE